jgi:hypothetical protein
MTNLQSVTQPTSNAERTLVGALGALCALALIFGAAVLFPAWPVTTAAERIHYLGWALLLSVLGILIMVIALASPWLGTVRISGMGGAIAIDGDMARAIGADTPPNSGSSQS